MLPNKKSRAVFLDRDGVINEIVFHENLGILESPFSAKDLKIKEGVPHAIRRLNRLGFKVIVVSNQPSVAMGRLTPKTLGEMTQKMNREIERSGGHLDDVLYCIHHPLKGKGALKVSCACRKPKPGLLLRAARKHNVDLARSYIVGDSITDIEAGLKAGCATILVAHLKCDVCALMARRGIWPHHHARDLREAVLKIQALEP